MAVVWGYGLTRYKYVGDKKSYTILAFFENAYPPKLYFIHLASFSLELQTASIHPLIQMYLPYLSISGILN